MGHTNRSPDHRRLLAELLHPHPVRYYCDLCTGIRICRAERAAQGRSDAENVEVIRRDQYALHRARFRHSDSNVSEGVRREALDPSQSVAHDLVIGGPRHLHPAVRPATIAKHRHTREALLLRHRRVWKKEQRVEHRERGDRHGHPNRETSDDPGRVHARRSQRAECVADVLCNSVEPCRQA